MIRGRKGFEQGSLSILSVVEVLRGIESEEKRGRAMELLDEAFNIYSLDRDVALSYVDIYFELKRKRQSAGDVDLLIAATARAKDEVIMTADSGLKKFRPMVKVEIVGAES